MKHKINILFATDGLGNGGKERQLVETLKNIDKNSFVTGVITFNQNQYYEELVKNVSDYYFVHRKNINILEPFFSVINSFEIFKPDIVHSFDILSSAYTYLPSKLFNSKIVNATIQDAGLDKGWQYKMKKYFLSHSDLNISNSAMGLSYYSAEGEVLYNFLDLKRFSGQRSRNSFDIAMVANFSDYKDYSTYFDVVKLLLESNLIDKAYAVGDGKYLNFYKDKIYRDQLLNSKVIFTGTINNIEDFLKDITLGFLFSTEKYGEGISNSVLEYMSAGVIPIVSNIGASSEIIENGKDGYLVDKNNIKSIVNIVRELRENEDTISSIRENSANKIKCKFNISINLSKLEKYYFSLLNTQ